MVRRSLPRVPMYATYPASLKSGGWRVAVWARIERHRKERSMLLSSIPGFPSFFSQASDFRFLALWSCSRHHVPAEAFRIDPLESAPTWRFRSLRRSLERASAQALGFVGSRRSGLDARCML
jgi:hypothetical protein